MHASVAIGDGNMAGKQFFNETAALFFIWWHSKRLYKDAF